MTDVVVFHHAQGLDTVRCFGCLVPVEPQELPHAQAEIGFVVHDEDGLARGHS